MSKIFNCTRKNSEERNPQNNNFASSFIDSCVLRISGVREGQENLLH